MKVFIIVCGLFLAFAFFACCNMSGDCSRQEEAEELNGGAHHG